MSLYDAGHDLYDYKVAGKELIDKDKQEQADRLQRRNDERKLPKRWEH